MLRSPCLRAACGAVLLVSLSASAFGAPEPKFRTLVVDPRIGVGSDLAIADVDGDGKLDILIADKQALVWYRNPDWTRINIAGKLSDYEHITISAAAEKGGSGRLERLAVTDGKPWDPTATNGKSFYLTPPPDRTQPWTATALPLDATAHRSQWWFAGDGSLALMEVPLHGLNNKDGAGEGMKLALCRTSDPVVGKWSPQSIQTSLHLSHSFIPENDGGAPGRFLIGCKEGVAEFTPETGDVKLIVTAERDGSQGAGEVGCGHLPGGRRFIATVEPMHGTQVVVYAEKPDHSWERKVVDGTLTDAHALVVGDLLGVGSDQVVAGSRQANAAGKFGVNFYAPPGDSGDWRKTSVDENDMACERLALADLNGDGKLDIIAAGRATKNVKVYFNETPVVEKP